MIYATENLAAFAEAHGPGVIFIEWQKRLRCSVCGSAKTKFVLSGHKPRRAVARHQAELCAMTCYSANRSRSMISASSSNPLAISRRSLASAGFTISAADRNSRAASRYL